jgi:hypothetical protein
MRCGLGVHARGSEVSCNALLVETRCRDISDWIGTALTAKPRAGKVAGPTMVGEPGTWGSTGGMSSLLRRRQRDIVLG